MRYTKNNNANQLSRKGFEIFKAVSNDQTNCKGYSIFFERKNGEFAPPFRVDGMVDLGEADELMKALRFAKRGLFEAYISDDDDYLIARTSERGHCSTEELSVSDYITAMDNGWAIAITMEEGDSYAEIEFVKDGDFSHLTGIVEIHTKSAVLKFK